MLLDLPITELHKRMREKRLSPRSLVEEVYRNIEALDTEMHAFITVREKSEVLKEADVLGKEAMRGPLHGIPFSVKDCYVTKGIKTTAGSAVLGTLDRKSVV